MAVQRCAVVDQTTKRVTNLVIADPAVDPAPNGDSFVASASAQIGDAYDSAAGTFTTPAPSYTVDQLCALIDAFRDQRLAAGFADSVTGKTFQATDKDLTKLTAVGSSALAAHLTGNDTKTFEVIAADNSTVTLDAPDTLALLNDRMMAWVSATVFYGKSLKDQTRAGTPPADYTAGWP